MVRFDIDGFTAVEGFSDWGRLPPKHLPSLNMRHAAFGLTGWRCSDV